MIRKLLFRKPDVNTPTLKTTEKRVTWQSHGYLLLSALIPMLLVYLIYVCKGLHPFGNGCVLVLDLNGQYVWFFEALRNFVKGDASLLYSFARAMGGDFLGIYAYYIASPLSYIVCLFPEDRMLEALLALFLLKTGLCGATFSYYMHKTAKIKNQLAILLFAICYALSSYAVVQQHNTMWIDAVMWLPLITLGIESLVREGKFKMYTFFLAVTLFSNFYIGYMVCIYCLLYFFYYYFAHGEEENNPLRERAHFAKSLSRMALYSLIAVGIAMVILLGAYYSLNFGKTTFSNPDWEWKMNFDILDFLYKLLPGSYDTVRPDGLPFVYCGLLPLLFLPIYYLSDKYPMRQKILATVFLAIFFFSFTFNVPDLIWHGFQRPNWLNYRYSFMFCFFLCVLACRGLSAWESVSVKPIVATGGFIAVICVILQKYTDEAYVIPNDYTCIFFTLIMVFAYLATLGILRRATDKQIASAMLLALVSIELFLNGLWNLNGLDKDVSFSRYSYYNDFLDRTRPITETVQERDTSFYRMEKTMFRKVNDNMALNIRGLSGSTSTLNKETIKLLNKLGYSSKAHWSKYIGGTPVNDSLMGIKYVISEKDVYSNYYNVFVGDHNTGYVAYQNPYALSIAYGVDEALLDFPLGFYTSEDPVLPEPGEEKEESKISLAVDAVKDKLNEWLGIEEIVGDSYLDEYDSPFERLNGILTAMLGEEETLRVFVPIPVESVNTKNLTKNYYVGGEHGYSKIDEEDEGVFSYSFKMPEDVSAELFFYLPSNYPREISLSLVNKEVASSKGTFNGAETSCIVSLGIQNAGDELTLDMTLAKEKVYILTGTECFYYIDWDLFEDVMARLGEDQFLVTEHTESYLSGTFQASREHELVLTTLPYDIGWRIYVDGERVTPVKALGGMLAFYIDGAAGETHELELNYLPNAFVVGAVISVVSLLLFVALILLERFCKRLPIIRSVVGIPARKETSETTEERVKVEPQKDAPLTPPAKPEAPADAPDEEPQKELKLRFRFPSEKNK